MKRFSGGRGRPLGGIALGVGRVRSRWGRSRLKDGCGAVSRFVRSERADVSLLVRCVRAGVRGESGAGWCENSEEFGFSRSAIAFASEKEFNLGGCFSVSALGGASVERFAVFLQDVFRV